ncbi:SPOR domain-containing protein [Bowmanella dokdonensis]|uniref:SPOR domain-containing protein n=1 Tax=Bowmanella dokdonensis TaxID=751969 RepID=A0A939DJI6_9ALTE|nr:SPOR domain-containing protein [Bowmanella dokdonensis]MBN7823807.1 hypothetical protein [Bowmanella dokdonensis]
MQAAFIDLHKRLQHLTSFAAGLVLLAGEDRNRQQAFATEFLGEQDPSTNIALLRAAEGREDAAYRHQLISQLVGNVRLDSKRPLTQTLLKICDQQDQAVMIAISAAEHLSGGLVQELWAMVQHQSARGKAFCVILLGSKAWALAAREKLPSPGQPVLLNVEFDAAAEKQLSELDQLIAQKRQAFNQRLANRQIAPLDAPAPLTARVWFRVLILFAFLTCFAALLIWLYPQSLNLLWPDSAQTKTPTPNTRPLSAPQATQAAETAPTEQPPAVESRPDPVPTQVEDEGQTVTDWAEEVQKMQQKLKESPKAEAEPAAQALNEIKETGPQTAEPVAQLPASPVIEEPEASEPGRQQLDDSVPTPNQWLWDEQKLLALPENSYLLQLFAASDPQVLAAAVRDLGLADKTWRYQTQRYGGPWHVLLSNQVFASLEEARAAVSGLPQTVQAASPFAKTLGQIRSEILREPE